MTNQLPPGVIALIAAAPLVAIPAMFFWSSPVVHTLERDPRSKEREVALEGRHSVPRWQAIHRPARVAKRGFPRSWSIGL